YDFLVSPMDERKRAILQVGRVSDPLPPTAALPLNKVENAFVPLTKGDGREAAGGRSHDQLAALLPTLNASQSEAIHRAVNCSVFHLIWGPPGTGKTKVIPEIVRRVCGSVLLGAFTNTAVDKMLIALLDHDPTTRFLRVGRSSDSPELVRKIGGD